jgi:acid phosphatase
MSRISVTAALAFIVAAFVSTSAHADWSCKPEDRARHTLDTPAANRPYNIDQLKAQLRDYRYCGDYDLDIAEVLRQAREYLQQHARDYPNPAVVLDIDETSLSNWLRIEADDFGFVPGGMCSLDAGAACGDMAWELSGLAEAIKPTLELFMTAKDLGITIFFVTGRRDRSDLRKATIKNLEEVGYVGFAGLYMRPIASIGDVRTYKTAVRHEIQKKFRIIANIGDQKSDLDDGKEADKAFLVPNPFYYIP